MRVRSSEPIDSNAQADCSSGRYRNEKEEVAHPKVRKVPQGLGFFPCRTCIVTDLRGLAVALRLLPPVSLGSRKLFLRFLHRLANQKVGMECHIFLRRIQAG